MKEDKINKLLDIIRNNKFKEIVKEYNKLNEDYNKTSFNIFEVISEKYHYEDFHSDILAVILENDKKFFFKLIDFLKTKKNTVTIENYDNYEIVREKSVDNKRIDVYIDGGNNVIIIENKFNDAVDQEKQLLNYYEGISGQYKQVDAIVYLTFDGSKKPDYRSYDNKDEKKKVEDNLIEMSYFSYEEDNKNTINSFIEDRLSKLKKEDDNEDLYSFIYQYNKLLKNLKGQVMDYKNMDNFYELIKDNFSEALDFLKMFENIDKYLIERIKKKINYNNIKPFVNAEIYNDDYEKEKFVGLILRANDDKYSDFAIQITRYFYEQDKNNYKDKYLVEIFKWDDKNDKNKILKNISDKFNMKRDTLYWEEGWNRYYETFNLNEENKIEDFVKKIVEEIKNK